MRGEREGIKRVKETERGKGREGGERGERVIERYVIEREGGDGERVEERERERETSSDLREVLL